MDGVDAEFVEQSADHIGQVAEWVVLVDAFHRPAVAGHVGHDHPELLCECVDVAGIIGRPGGARSAAVQHHHGGPAAGFGHEHRLTGHGEDLFGQSAGGHTETPLVIGVETVLPV
jgi:hypothetical protein